MLELHDPNGAFAALEAYLADEGFWGRDGLAADLFLGYRLSEPLRRLTIPPPPEPCPLLPALACRIRPANVPTPPPVDYSLGEWERTWDDEAYAAAIGAVRAAIERGDVYQVNLVQHLSAPFEGDPGGLAPSLAPLRPLQPRPLAGAISLTPRFTAPHDADQGHAPRG